MYGVRSTSTTSTSGTTTVVLRTKILQVISDPSLLRSVTSTSTTRYSYSCNSTCTSTSTATHFRASFIHDTLHLLRTPDDSGLGTQHSALHAPCSTLNVLKPVLVVQLQVESNEVLPGTCTTRTTGSCRAGIQSTSTRNSGVLGVIRTPF
jgi:hypothetical protein